MTIILKQAKAILCISTITLLFGCAEQTIFKNIPILEDVEVFLAEQIHSASNESDKNIEAISEEKYIENKRPTEPGDIVAIHEHDSEKKYDVRVDKIFHAASNRLCIYFHEPNKPKRKEPSGLACLGDDRRWIKIPLRIIKNT